MNKFFRMNSFFTKIILAVLSFAVIICIFIPYMQIPAVKAVHDIDVANRKMSIYIGKEAETVNIISEFCNGQPYLIYKDEELTETVEKTSLPTPDAENIYYLAIYAYGYDVTDADKKLDFHLISTYTVTLTKDTKNNSPVSVTRNNVTKTISIRVPNATNFDFTRVIDPRSTWAQYPNSTAGLLEGRDTSNEVKSLAIAKGEEKTYYMAVSLRSEENPTNPDGGEVYYPLEMYTLTVKRDATRKTLPTVAEVGMGVMSLKNDVDATSGIPEIYTGDAIMFAFMIAAAISTLFAFVIPPKFKAIELIVSIILGGALVAFPLADYLLYFQKAKFYTEAGWIILMVLGVLIILAGVFDFIRCTSEYKAEQIRIYGEDAFKKHKKVKAPKAPKAPKAEKAE